MMRLMMGLLAGRQQLRGPPRSSVLASKKARAVAPSAPSIAIVPLT